MMSEPKRLLYLAVHNSGKELKHTSSFTLTLRHKVYKYVSKALLALIVGKIVAKPQCQDFVFFIGAFNAACPPQPFLLSVDSSSP